MNAERRWEETVTETVIGAAMEVSNVPGAGFLEKVYERAMVRELALRGVGVFQEVLRFFHELRVQANVSGLMVAAPPFGLHALQEIGCHFDF